MGASLDSMISSLEANGVAYLPLSMVGDLMDIDHRVKYGDECGWRGDPSMGVFINRLTGEFEVWGIDRHNNEYKAASHDKLDHTLLLKLRDGDPQKNDVFQRVLDHNQKLKDDQDRADRERLAELGDRMQWAIRRDFAQHLGGKARQYAVGGPSSPLPKKKDGA